MSFRETLERASIAFALTAGAAPLLMAAAPVRADEAYLCAKDKIVYVAVADLERMKRTDPCIAAYYGMRVEAPDKAPDKAPVNAPVKASAGAPEKVIGKAAVATPATARVTTAEAVVKTIEQKPAARAAALPAAAPRPELKPLADAAETRRTHPAQIALAEPAVRVAPGTDFRNVRVLNASSPVDAVFHHSR